MATPLLIKPSQEEITHYMREHCPDMPDIEAQKFFNYYSANGWKVGRVAMQSWTHAVAGWHLRWQERQKQAVTTVNHGNRSLDRICDRLRNKSK